MVAFAGLAITGLSAHVTLPLPLCPFKLLFHCPCPGCGITRSIMALWHGDLLLSFRFHPLGVPVVLIAVALVLQPFIRNTFRMPILSVRRLRVVVGLGAATMIAVWIVRLGFILSGSMFFLW
jgi:hypothetical protein